MPDSGEVRIGKARTVSAETYAFIVQLCENPPGPTRRDQPPRLVELLARLPDLKRKPVEPEDPGQPGSD